ncbi:MAG: PhnD/SsuA/transferrin family substrate-binding protein [Ignavibacteria bacterium]
MQDSTETKYFRFAFSKHIFFGINLNDARLALGLLLDKYIESEEIDYSSNISIYSDWNAIIEEHKKDPFDVIFLLSSEYLQLKEKIELEPILASSRSSMPFTRYYLVVKKGGGIKNIKDLQNKRIELYSNDNPNISLTFRVLERLCENNFNKKSNKVFSNIEISEDPHSSLLKVFFGNSDACIIEDFQFSVISELNPQLLNSLDVLYKSEKFVTGVACITPYNTEVDLFFNKSIHMHETVYGKQFLNVLKINRVFRISPEDLETIKVLFTDKDD